MRIVAQGQRISRSVYHEIGASRLIGTMPLSMEATMAQLATSVGTAAARLSSGSTWASAASTVRP